MCVIVLFLINSPIKNWRGLQYVSIHYVIIQMRFAPFNELYIWTSEMINGVQFVQSFYKVARRTSTSDHPHIHSPNVQTGLAWRIVNLEFISTCILQFQLYSNDWIDWTREVSIGIANERVTSVNHVWTYFPIVWHCLEWIFLVLINIAWHKLTSLFLAAWWLRWNVKPFFCCKVQLF